MALLKAGPLGVDIRISRVLGDRTARSISGAEYLVNFSSPLGKMTPVVVEDSEPDHFYTAFEDALLSRGPTVHSTIDEQLCFGVYPVEPPEWVLARHTLPCEPADFAGIPEDVFKVVISLNISSKGPLGSGIAPPSRPGYQEIPCGLAQGDRIGSEIGRFPGCPFIEVDANAE